MLICIICRILEIATHYFSIPEAKWTGKVFFIVPLASPQLHDYTRSRGNSNSSDVLKNAGRRLGIVDNMGKSEKKKSHGE